MVDGSSVKIIFGSHQVPINVEAAAKASALWSVRLRDRARWRTSTKASERVLEQVVRALADFGLEDEMRSKLAREQQAELVFDFSQASNSLKSVADMPWEAMLALATTRERARRPITIFRTYLSAEPTEEEKEPPSATSESGSRPPILFVSSAPCGLDNIYDFDIEETLVVGDSPEATHNFDILRNPSRPEFSQRVTRLKPICVHLSGFDPRQAHHNSVDFVRAVDRGAVRASEHSVKEWIRVTTWQIGARSTRTPAALLFGAGPQAEAAEGGHRTHTEPQARDAPPDALVALCCDFGKVTPLLNRLSAKLREVVDLSLKGLAFAEIGAILGIEEGTARLRFFRAVERLREWLFPRAGPRPTSGGRRPFGRAELGWVESRSRCDASKHLTRQAISATLSRYHQSAVPWVPMGRGASGFVGCAARASRVRRTGGAPRTPTRRSAVRRGVVHRRGPAGTAGASCPSSSLLTPRLRTAWWVRLQRTSFWRHDASERSPILLSSGRYRIGASNRPTFAEGLLPVFGVQTDSPYAAPKHLQAVDQHLGRRLFFRARCGGATEKERRCIGARYISATPTTIPT